MSQREALIRSNVRILDEGIRVIERLDDATYARSEPRLASSGVGSHVRHCIDFYECLFAGLVDGRVNYDARERDVRLERSCSAVIQRLRDVKSRLRGMRGAGVPRPLVVRLDAAQTGSDEVPWTTSSLDRELQSLISHTVHHFAVVAMILRVAGHDPGREFGVAPSTLHSWQESRTCAP